MIQYRMLNLTGIPARVTRVCFEGSGSSSLSNYQFSQAQTTLSTKTFGFRFATAFGTTVPTLYIRIYDAVAGSLLVTDNTATPTGTWQKSTNNGATYGAYNTTDLANTTTYITYTPSSIADNIDAQPVLSLS
jgi:hypothetical protein